MRRDAQRAHSSPRPGWLARLGTGVTLVALSVLAPLLSGETSSAFSSLTSTGARFASAADWVAPEVTSTVAQKIEGGSPGFVRPGANYRVFAATRDLGNPPSGVASARADLRTVTSTATDVTLDAGTFSAFGVAYDRRTPSTYTAGAALADGARTYSVTVADAKGQSRTSTGHVVTIDGRRPTATNLGAANRGAIVGKMEQGDFFVLDFDEPMDPTSLVPGWFGTGAASVSVQVANNDPAVSGRDALRVCRTTATGVPCSPTAGLGYIDLGSAAWVSGTRNFAGSTITQSGNRLTITLGTPDSTAGFGTVTATNMTWHPESVAYDRAGNLAVTTTWTEGLSDDDF